MTKYSLSSRIIHWVMAVIIIPTLMIGIYMTNFLDKESPSRMDIYNLHKSFGVVVLILIIIRILNRSIFKAPALPDTLKKSEKFLSKMVNISFYFLMIAIPLSGYLMSNSAGYPVKLFSLQMPALIEGNQNLLSIFHEAHEIFGYALLLILSLHIIAVFKHRFFDKPENDVLKRMV
jgi:cytochrome b561